MARKVGCYVKAGRRAYVTPDLVERIREWEAQNSEFREEPLHRKVRMRSRSNVQLPSASSQGALEVIREVLNKEK